MQFSFLFQNLPVIPSSCMYKFSIAASSPARHCSGRVVAPCCRNSNAHTSSLQTVMPTHFRDREHSSLSGQKLGSQYASLPCAPRLPLMVATVFNRPIQMILANSPMTPSAMFNTIKITKLHAEIRAENKKRSRRIVRAIQWCVAGVCHSRKALRHQPSTCVSQVRVISNGLAHGRVYIKVVKKNEVMS